MADHDIDVGNAQEVDAPWETIERKVDMWLAPKLGAIKRIYRNYYVVSDVHTVPATLELADGFVIEVPGASCMVTYTLLNDDDRRANREETPSFERVPYRV